MHYLPTAADMVRSLPLDEQAAFLAIAGRAGIEEAGPRWLVVPGEVWDAFTAAVKRGDYDRK